MAGLPFQVRGYLESMREPKWRAGSSHVVRYEPRIIVRFTTQVPQRTLEKLCTLVDPPARIDGRSDDGDGTITLSSSPYDPWQWFRAVVKEILMPLLEVTQLETVELRVERTIEYNSGD